MAEKSEQIDALLDAIRDANARLYVEAAQALHAHVAGEPPKVRMEAYKQVALVGRPIELHHAAAMRSRKISAAKHKASVAKAVGEEAAMNDDEPWTEDRIERLHAALERRLGPVARTLEFKRMVRERVVAEGGRSAGAAELGGAGAPEAAADAVGDLADAGRSGRG